MALSDQTVTLFWPPLTGGRATPGHIGGGAGLLV
jgi:hypothetical protein